MNTAKLDAELERKNLAGYWSVRARGYQADAPYIWKWNDLYDGLMQASEQVGFEFSERRSIRLVNPNVPGDSTSRNLQISFPSSIPVRSPVRIGTIWRRFVS